MSLLCLNHAKSPTVAALLITVALSLSSFSQAGFLLNIQVSLFDHSVMKNSLNHNTSVIDGCLIKSLSNSGNSSRLCWISPWHSKLSRNISSNNQHNRDWLFRAVAGIISSIPHCHRRSLFCYNHLLEPVCYRRTSLLD